MSYMSRMNLSWGDLFRLSLSSECVPLHYYHHFVCLYIAEVQYQAREKWVDDEESLN